MHKGLNHTKIYDDCLILSIAKVNAFPMLHIKYTNQKDCQQNVGII